VQLLNRIYASFRDTYCYNKVLNDLQGWSEAVGRAWVDGNMDKEAKPQVESMAEEFREAFRDLLVNENDWMTDDTKVTIIMKSVKV